MLALAGGWATVEPLLRPLEQAFAERRGTLPALVEVLIAAGETLCGDALWAGPAGRAASDLLVRLGQHGDALGEVDPAELRSEEHTSELQSLMRISYAVFCLKKKKQNEPYM